MRGAGHKLYVLIDEYDHFANRLLAGGAEDVYEAIVKRTGFGRRLITSSIFSRRRPPAMW